MHKPALLFLLLVAGCSPAADDGVANQTAEKATKPERPAYCFFKDAETKDWSASRDAQGNIVVKGRAFRSDPRYKAELGPAMVSGSTATLSPTIVQNGGYASPDNWWDVTSTIPNSATVTKVTVACGKKVLAELSPQR